MYPNSLRNSSSLDMLVLELVNLRFEEYEMLEYYVSSGRSGIASWESASWESALL